MTTSEVTSPPSSSSSPFTPSWKYHVFLSFRGEDTRYNFTDRLYTALCRKRINAFTDDDLRRGQRIKTALDKAIEESRISVIVFSKSYASSKWCLDELVKILECKESKQQMVIPVFYKVSPSDVRNQKGSFGDALAELESKYKDDREKVHKWREALSDVANLSGWTLLNEDESEPQLIHNIVQEISVQVKKWGETSNGYIEEISYDNTILPVIEGLQIAGKAFPGQKLDACGYSINGTTSCNFQWARHLDDGSVHYIDGATQPSYIVTADDVDTCLAVEVLPLDRKERKGELGKFFANENKKVTCDPEMKCQIERSLHKGHASFKIFLSAGFLDIWEPATLAITRETYSIKCSGGPSGNGTLVTEKCSLNTVVTVPYGSPIEFIITIGSGGGGSDGGGGSQDLLKTDNKSCYATPTRDTVVLTLRAFIKMTNARKNLRKRIRKKLLFF